MPAGPLNLALSDVLFVLLSSLCVVLVTVRSDKVKTAATLYVLSLPIVDLPLAHCPGLRALTLFAVALALLVLALATHGDFRQLGSRAWLLACAPLLLLLVWAALSGILSTRSGGEAWLRFARPALTSIVVALAVRRLLVARSMASAFVIIMAALSVLGVAQSFWGRFFWSIGKTAKPGYEYFIELPSGLVRAPGTFQDPNNMGIFAALAFLLVASSLFEGAHGRRQRLGLMALAGLLLAGMAGSLTRSAVLATGLGLLLLWPPRRAHGRRLRLLLGAAVLATAVVLLLRALGGGPEQMGSVAHRLLYWKTAARVALEHPLVGVGLGSFDGFFLAAHAELPPKILGLTSHRPHNAFLQMAAETGLVGLACFTAFVGIPLLRLLRRRDAAGRLGAALLAAVVAHAALHNVLLQDLFWLVVGVAVALSLQAPEAEAGGAVSAA